MVWVMVVIRRDGVRFRRCVVARSCCSVRAYAPVWWYESLRRRLITRAEVGVERIVIRRLQLRLRLFRTSYPSQLFRLAVFPVVTVTIIVAITQQDLFDPLQSLLNIYRPVPRVDSDFVIPLNPILNLLRGRSRIFVSARDIALT